jgi:hypothetical protein
MKAAEIKEQCRLLRQEVPLAGDTVDALPRHHRAEVDVLRFGVEVLRRSLRFLHADLAEPLQAIRAQVVSTTGPEAS